MVLQLMGFMKETAMTKTSIMPEGMEDFVSIVTSFCSRIYGRKRKLKTKRIIEEIKNNE